MRLRVPVLLPGLVAAACALSGMSFVDAYALSDVLPVLLVCSVGAVGVVTALRVGVQRPHAAVSVAAIAAGFVIAAAVTVLIPALGWRPSVDWSRTIIEGLTGGWADLLTATSPAPPRAELLVVPAATIWVSSAVAAELLFRTRLVLSILAPPVVGAIVGISVSSGSVASSIAVPCLFVLVGAAFVVARTSDLSTSSRSLDQRPVRDGRTLNGAGGVRRSVAVHRGLTAVPAATAVAVLAGLLATWLPVVDANEAVLLRDSYEPAEDLQVDLSPLASVGAPAGGADSVAFTVSLDRLPKTSVRMRVEVLDQFDGIQWGSGAEFVEAGSAVPQIDTAGGTDGSVVRQTVELKDYQSQFLPAANRPVELEVPMDASVRIDPVTGVLVTSDPEAVSGLAYQVQSFISSPDTEKLETSGVATTPDARRAVDFEYQLPENATDVGRAVTASAATPFQQVALLLALFRNTNPSDTSKHDFQLQPDQRVSLDESRITSFIVGEKPEDRSGPPQLFAAGFAALARAQGLPVRIAIGYELSPDITAGSPVQVKASQLTAWPEVAFDGLGWVAFEPYENESDLPPPPEQRNLDAAVQQATDQSQSNDGTKPADNPNAKRPEQDQGVAGWLVVVVGFVAAALLAMLVPPVMKWRRRNRRISADSTADRVVGAWREVVDRLIERGLTRHDKLTPAEIEAATPALAGAGVAADVHQLGILVNAAIHAGSVPSEAAAAEAWDLCARASSEIRSNGTFAKRTRANLSLRALVGSERSSVD